LKEDNMNTKLVSKNTFLLRNNIHKFLINVYNIMYLFCCGHTTRRKYYVTYFFNSNKYGILDVCSINALQNYDNSSLPRALDN
jgi:hypothetical protein